MKTTFHLSPTEFISFASSLFRERELAFNSLQSGDIVGAMVHLEYMETILSDTMQVAAQKSAENWRTISNCTREILANDIPHEARLSAPQSMKFTEDAARTISKFLRQETEGRK